MTFIIFTVIFLSVVQVIVSNRLSTTGTTLAQFEEEIMFYKKENSLLRERLLMASSLTHIASTAGEIGFVKNKSQVFFTTPLPLAVRQ